MHQRCRAHAAWSLLAASLMVSGCDKQGPHVRIDDIVWGERPSVATPVEALRSLESAWNRRSGGAYDVLFTQDYVFAFSALDPAGDAYRAEPWTREDEMLFAYHLFYGGQRSEPTATNISLQLDRNLNVQDDPRPGKDPRWHKYVHSGLFVSVVTPMMVTEIAGFGGFYLVRGDSAAVPVEIVPLGFAPDSTHWYIDRWEDDTAGSGGGARAMPAEKTTLGQLKALYHGDAATPAARRGATSLSERGDTPSRML